MDYEKKYKEALDKLQEALAPKAGCEISGLTRRCIEEVFPELKESEDERIRKWLLDTITQIPNDSIEWDVIEKAKVLAWLEKQKSVGEIVERCKNSWYNEGKIAGQFESITDDKKYQQGWHDALEKQGEQKVSVNDFKAKDWYVSKVDGNIHDMTYDAADKVEPKNMENETEIPFGANDSELTEVTYYIPKGFHAEIDDDKVVIKIGEKKPIMNVPSREVILAIWDLGNEWKELTKGSISTEYGTQLDYIQKHWCESEYYLREKQGEQKPINDTDEDIVEAVSKTSILNMVEPKFKVGDWIITKDENVHKDYSVCKIVEIENNRYHLENGDYLDIDTLEQYDYHLWTIQDAKDGDVLACGDKVYDCPFIFHNLTEELNPRSYCGVNTLRHFQDNDENGGFWCKSNEVRPATKEQRDLLFQKMEEAGYQWDAEKKELKLLVSNGGDFESDDSEQKPTWSDEDERMKMALVEYFDGMKKDGICANGVHPDKIIDWLKNKKDEQMEEIRG